MKMQGLLLKTEDFPVETAEHEAQAQEPSEGRGESLGYCTGCVPRKSFLGDFPLTSFLNSHKLVFLGARSGKQPQRPEICGTFPSWAPVYVLTNLPGDVWEPLPHDGFWCLRRWRRGQMLYGITYMWTQKMQQTSEYSRKETHRYWEQTSGYPSGERKWAGQRQGVRDRGGTNYYT